MKMVTILDRCNIFFYNRDLKMNRSIVAAAPIAAPDRDLPTNIQSQTKLGGPLFNFNPIEMVTSEQG